MKMMKNLLLGTAVGFMAVPVAQAADLPVKAKPVQYVKVCDQYGAGFYYMPGSDICIKIGGYVRNQHYWNAGTSSTATLFFSPSPPATRLASDDNLYSMRMRTVASIDTRTQSDYGTIRTYLTLGWTQDYSSAATTALYANRAFIQFAGFTFGKATSFYDLWSSPYNSYFAIYSSDSGDGGWGVAAYTAQLGNGVSLTIAAEEARRQSVSNAIPTAAGVSPGLASWAIGGIANTIGQGDFKYPDVVAALRVDQAWGSAQVMGAIHDISAGYYFGTTSTQLISSNAHPSDKVGWAVGVGGIFNTDVILGDAKGSKASFQFNYTEGAPRYANITQTPTSSMSLFGANRVFGMGPMAEAVYSSTATGGVGAQPNLELTKVWGVNAAYDHVWNPQWKTSVYGSYLKWDYNTNATTSMCATSPFNAITVATCNPDFSYFQVGSRTQWNVTKDFYMGVDVMYSGLNTMSKGGIVPTSASGFPAVNNVGGNYTLKDMNAWAGTFRVHRDFLP